MKKKIIASAVLSILSFGAMADNPSFDNVEFGYTESDFDGGFEVDGFELKGSKEISDNFYIAGDFTRLSENGFDFDATTVGIGYKLDFTNSSTFFSEVDYARFDVDGGNNEDGYQITAGVRSMLTDRFELKAAIEYLDINDADGTFYVLGGAYSFTDKLAVYADYSYESDVSAYGVGVRYNF
ncbi:MAG: hypothetical protein KUG78_10535 [Kangiellaceae bacterium]|nr:hypothetical protein [Kangiellaceae bacterium]